MPHPQPEREPGRDVFQRRFPSARPIWSLTTPRRDFPRGFTVTAYQLGGRVVLLQEFGAASGHSWDVYVPASDSGRVDLTLDCVAIATGQEIAPTGV